MSVKHKLAAHIPRDQRFKRFVRWGQWKCVFPQKGNPMLFDYEGEYGISEQNDVAKTHPQVIIAIRAYLKRTGNTKRRVTIPDQEKEN